MRNRSAPGKNISRKPNNRPSAILNRARLRVVSSQVNIPSKCLGLVPSAGLCGNLISGRAIGSWVHYNSAERGLCAIRVIRLLYQRAFIVVQ
jgi:hypothetical protein